MVISLSRRPRHVAIAAVALACGVAAALPSAAAARDCPKGRSAPAHARDQFSLLRDAPTALSAKRRASLCGIASFVRADVGQARRISSPMHRKGAWFLVPGADGVLLDTGGGGAAATYAQIRQRGWFGYFVAAGPKAKYLGAAVDGYDRITATGLTAAGDHVTYAARIRHNVFVLPTPGADPARLTIMLSGPAPGRGPTAGR